MNENHEQGKFVIQVRQDSDPLAVVLTPVVRTACVPCDEVLAEGYDPHNSPLRRPVWWRVERRGDRKVYCSDYIATREEIHAHFGERTDSLLRPDQQRARVTIETELPDNETMEALMSATRAYLAEGEEGASPAPPSEG